MLIHFFQNVVQSEVIRFSQYTMLNQAFYLFYIVSGFILPLGHVRRWKKLHKGNSGIGDNCVMAEIYMAFWRFAPLFYSFTVIISVPLFLSVFFDLLGRLAVIHAMAHSHNRASADS